MTTTKLSIETTGELEKQAIPGKVFGYFARALPLTRKAVVYLQGRGIDFKLLIYALQTRKVWSDGHQFMIFCYQ
jgi:hypothetical protein